MKISDIFEVNQGIQITDEEIYSSSGNIPIYTANNEIKGYCDQSIIEEKDLPCLTYPTKAFSGKIFVQNKKFNANNTAILIPKNNYKKEINLDYFAILLGKKFMNYLSSESQVSYLGKEILVNIDITYPSIEEQDAIVKLYEKLEGYKNILIQNIEEIEDTIKQLLSLKNTKQFIMNDIALFNKGSNKISEESIYQNFDKDGIPIYSSATENKGLMGKVSKSYYKNMDKKGNKGELTWTTNGYAGVVFYRDTNYLYSEKCGRIIIRKDYKNFINPKFLMYQLNNITYKYKTSESNNGKLDIIHMKHIPILLPIENDNISIDIQNKVVEQYEKLEKMKYDLQSILDEINKTL